MKRFITAVAFCTSLLVLCFFLVRPTSSENEDLVMRLLDLPAPPPLNPLVENNFRLRDKAFYDPRKPPPDDAPIEDLIDYWENQGSGYSDFYYKPKPSAKVLERLIAEMGKDPTLVSRLLGSLPETDRSVEMVKSLYDASLADGDENIEQRSALREWLKRNSTHFTGDLERKSRKIRDVNDYVDEGTREQLLSLTRHDFTTAKPIIDRLYLDASQPASRALATWALYKNALQNNSLSDIERYRDELKRIVGDRSLTDGTRDMAHDAIVLEGDFTGRDEWFFSLYEDETLVGMERFTMLTTPVNQSPPDKYVPQMIAFLERGSVMIRTAAARNLVVALQREQDPEKQKIIVRALLPWLTKPDWIKDMNDARRALVTALATLKIPESVPGLIAALDEKMVVDADDPSSGRYGYSTNANYAAADAGRTTSNAATNVNANANRANVPKITVYPLRSAAIAALGNQGDIRAVPPLRRMFNVVEAYEKSTVVGAIFRCNGFAVNEQVDAIETGVRMQSTLELPDEMREAINAVSNSMSNSEMLAEMESRVREYLMMSGGMSNAVSNIRPNVPVRFGDESFKLMLSSHLTRLDNPGNQLVNAAALRISELEKKEPDVAKAMREFVSRWNGRTVNAFILNDLKNDKASVASVVKVLAARVDIREHQFELISNAAAGTTAAAGIASCLAESNERYAGIIEGDNNEIRISMLACARLIRAKLPVAVVAKMLKSTDKRLALAAERYLETEDSPEARAAVLALYPGQAKITGATLSFRGSSNSPGSLMLVKDLFASVHPYFSRSEDEYGAYGPNYGSQFDAVEKRLQKEVVDDAKLIAAYAYDVNFVRVYKDGAVFSWEDDPSRYRERKLTPEEFEALKNQLVRNHAGDLPPFLACRGYCEPKQLLMVAKDSARRLYVTAERPPKFFAELDSLFKDFRSKPAKLRYWLEKEIPGLEILFADDDKRAETVWKNGGDTRLLVTDVKELEDRQKKLREAYEDDESDEENVEEAPEENHRSYASRYRYDGMSWIGLNADSTVATATQPAEVEYIVLPDDKDPPPMQGRWKLTAGDVELRMGEKGLFKIVRGKVTKISPEGFLSPVLTANGRWLIGYGFSETQPGLTRFNLQTNRAIKVQSEEAAEMVPIAFIPTVNKVLLGQVRYDHDYEEESPGSSARYDESQFLLIDPETGVLSQTTGEMRPIVHQTFRRLQPAGKPNEYWAALPDAEKNETRIGIYDMRAFSFRPVLTVPKIVFGSMAMWVDEAGRKAYFVYNGHLLTLPLDARPKVG